MGPLCGLSVGQNASLTLSNNNKHYRINQFLKKGNWHPCVERRTGGKLGCLTGNEQIIDQTADTHQQRPAAP